MMRVSFDGRFSIVISLERSGGGKTHRIFGVESFSVVIRGFLSGNLLFFLWQRKYSANIQ